MIDLNEAGEQRERQAAAHREMDQRPKIESALTILDPGCDRDTWVRIGQAIQDELGEEGREIFRTWSMKWDKFEEARFNETWRSFSRGGGITVGTLFKLAQEYGWSDTVPLREMTPEEVDVRRRAREEANRLNQEEEARNLERAKTMTALIMAALTPADNNTYLTRKQASKGHGLGSIKRVAVAEILRAHSRVDENEDLTKGRFAMLQGEELLVVPRFEGFEAEPKTVELIDAYSTKYTLKGGGVGLYFTAPHPALGTPDPLFLVGEGVATVLSAAQAVHDHSAIGVSAGSNGQILKACQAIKAQYPKARIIILADLIKTTGEPDQKAVEASQVLDGCFLAVPDFGPGREPGQKDFNDLACAPAHGLDAVRRCIERASLPVASRFEVLDRDAIMGLAPSGYIIKGIMPARGTGAIYGPSTVGKSFLELDMAAHIAEGRSWFGFRVKAHPVGILVLEGMGGTQKRIRAWEQYRGRRFPAGVKFLPPPVGGFDLREERDLNDLITRLQSSVGRGAVLFIDTLGQALPGCDENGGKDYSLALAMAGRIERALEGFVSFIGHTGKDATRGFRGNSNLFAGLDMALELASVPGETGRAAWTLKKSKDGEDGLTRHFKRIVVDLGQDEDGDLVTSCVVEPVDDACSNSSAKVKAMSPKDAERILAYRESAMRMGSMDNEGNFIGLDPEAWKQDFMFGCQDETAQDTKSKAFRRMKNGLIKSGWIKETLEGLLLPDGYGAHVQFETIQGALQERARTKAGHF